MGEWVREAKAWWPKQRLDLRVINFCTIHHRSHEAHVVHFSERRRQDVFNVMISWREMLVFCLFMSQCSWFESWVAWSTSRCRQDNNLHMGPAYSAQFWGLKSAIKKGKIQFFRSAQNFAVPISESPINSYDSDGGILISISVLGDEKWKLPFFCLHAFSRDPLDVSGRFIYRWKDIFKGNTAQLESWETVQWGRSYSRNKFDDYGP